MYQKDYILRMIEMIAEVIARILGLIKKGDPKQASILLENAYRDFLKEDASFFKNIDKNKLTNTLLSEHNFSNGHLQILAELFYAEAELKMHEQKSSLALEYYEKSLTLFQFVNQNSLDFSLSMVQKIDTLENTIASIKKKQ